MPLSEPKYYKLGCKELFMVKKDSSLNRNSSTVSRLELLCSGVFAEHFNPVASAAHYDKMLVPIVLIHNNDGSISYELVSVEPNVDRDNCHKIVSRHDMTRQITIDLLLKEL